jgi:hypothetical protein
MKYIYDNDRNSTVFNGKGQLLSKYENGNMNSIADTFKNNSSKLWMSWTFRYKLILKGSDDGVLDL